MADSWQKTEQIFTGLQLQKSQSRHTFICMARGEIKDMPADHPLAIATAEEPKDYKSPWDRVPEKIQRNFYRDKILAISCQTGAIEGFAMEGDMPSLVIDMKAKGVSNWRVMDGVILTEAFTLDY